jgi:hypothetical protein
MLDCSADLGVQVRLKRLGRTPTQVPWCRFFFQQTDDRRVGRVVEEIEKPFWDGVGISRQIDRAAYISKIDISGASQCASQWLPARLPGPDAEPRLSPIAKETFRGIKLLGESRVTVRIGLRDTEQ